MQDYHFARLDAGTLERIQQLESALGVVLVAFLDRDDGNQKSLQQSYEQSGLNRFNDHQPEEIRSDNY